MVVSVNLGPFVLFIKHRLTSSSDNGLEEIDNAYVSCLMYKILSSSRDCDDLSNGFHRSVETRWRELTKNKTSEVNYHVRIYLKGIIGFPEHQDKWTCGLGYTTTLQENKDNHVLNHLAGANDAANLALPGRRIIDDISLYVPYHTPNISNQKLMLGRIVSRAATELSYIKRLFCMKDVTTEENGPLSSV